MVAVIYDQSEIGSTVRQPPWVSEGSKGEFDTPVFMHSLLNLSL